MNISACDQRGSCTSQHAHAHHSLESIHIARGEGLHGLDLLVERAAVVLRVRGSDRALAASRPAVDLTKHDTPRAGGRRRQGGMDCALTQRGCQAATRRRKCKQANLKCSWRSQRAERRPGPRARGLGAHPQRRRRIVLVRVQHAYAHVLRVARAQKPAHPLRSKPTHLLAHGRRSRASGRPSRRGGALGPLGLRLALAQAAGSSRGLASRCPGRRRRCRAKAAEQGNLSRLTATEASRLVPGRTRAK